MVEVGFRGLCGLEVGVSFGKGFRAIATDSHFLVPLFVLLLGIGLLVVLH
jgi:hypothetical protein